VARIKAYFAHATWLRCALHGALLAGLNAALPAHAADVVNGAALYRQHCAACHGADGRPVMPSAPDFSRPTTLLKPDLVLLNAVRAGKGAMPAYQGQLRDREILDVVAHLRTLR
jgi:cytochrome c6